MVKLIGDNYCVDTTRLFANGFSYGGGMSYAIACARAKVFRGVAIYDGAQLSGCEGGNDPIAYWQMAGLTDTVCTVGAGNADARQVREEQRLHRPEPAPAASASALFGLRGARLHDLRRMLERASPSLVRAPVRSRQRHRRRHSGPLQFVRDTSEKLLEHVPLHLGPGRRVVVLHVLVDGRPRSFGDGSRPLLIS